MRCIDQRDVVGTLILDFRKAFDLVDHSILTYKFRYSTLKLFTSYIFGSSPSNNRIVIESENGMTRAANIKSGVPEGSILGPH